MQRLLQLFLLPSLVTLCGRTPPVAAGPVLILPFFNHSGAPELDWINESVAHRIGEVLASQNFWVVEREDRLEVCRRLSLAPYAELTRASMLKVAEELDAAWLLAGEFQLSPAAAEPGASPRRIIRMSGFLLDVRRFRKTASWVEQGPFEELARLQSQFAWQVLRTLAPEAAPPLEAFLAQSAPVRLDAMENYIRGLLATTPEIKHRYFTQAARLDPRYSAPCFQLGRLYFERKEYRLAAGWLARVAPSDPNFLHATFLLGLCRYYTGDFAGAAASFEGVARELPLNEVLNNLGAAQSRQGLSQALENILAALDGDPSDPDYHFNAGYALWKLGEFQAAADRFRAALARNPDDPEATLLLGRCLQNSGPRANDPRSSGLERLKHNFEDRLWRELKARVSRAEP